MSEDAVLVTGGAGYVGSHFVARLADGRRRYVVLDSLVRGLPEFVPAEHLVLGDIADEALVEEVCREFRVDVVVHFAAYAYVGESVGEPERYYENNVAKTVALLRATRRAGVERLVFSSSCASYGEPPSGSSIVETTPQAPVNPYGRTKLIVERMLDDYERAYGLRSVALRYFNAAGASEHHPLYEHHDPETHLIPLAIDAAIGDGELAVFGNDYPTPDGTCVRDYVHVDDLADAHVRAVDRLRNGGGSLRANLGIGRGASVLEVIDAVHSVTASSVRYSFAPRRAGDPPMLIANAELALRELDWRPRHRDPRDIMRSAATGYARQMAAAAALH